MNSRVSWGSWLLMAVLLGSAMATSACGSEVETQHSELNLEIHNRKLDLNPAVIKVNRSMNPKYVFSISRYSSRNVIRANSEKKYSAIPLAFHK